MHSQAHTQTHTHKKQTLHLNHEAECVTEAVNFPVTPAPTHQPNWHAESFLSPPSTTGASLTFFHIFSLTLHPSATIRKSSILSCLLFDSCPLNRWVRAAATAWQLLRTPNEFNHQAQCQHVISSLCLPGERWNYSGRNEGRREEGAKRRRSEEEREGTGGIGEGDKGRAGMNKKHSQGIGLC